MKKHYATLILFLLVSITNFSQAITAKIVDEENQPISYANIVINTFGTISNEEGEFNIQKEKFKQTDKVIISYLGYKTLEFPVNELDSKTYTLEENINDLSEIEVSNKVYSLDEILEKVKENIDSNYSNTLTKQQIFQRNTYYNKFKKFEFEFKKATLLKKKDIKSINRQLEDLITNNIDQSSTDYSENLSELYFGEKKQKIKILKATKLINKEKDKSSDKLQSLLISTIGKHLEKDATYKVSSGLFPIEDSLKIDDEFKKSLYKDSIKVQNTRYSKLSIINNANLKNEKGLDFIHKTNKYAYSLAGTSRFGDEKIYIINFTPKRSSASYTGTLYVNAYDFAIMKIKYHYAKGKSISHNYKFLLGVKYAQSKKNIEIIYQKNELDKYYLKFYKRKSVSYAFVNRSIKFKKNRKDRSEDKRVIKMEFLIETDNAETTEFFVLQNKPLSKTEFNKVKEAKKHKLHYISKYSPETWKGYNVISPVEEIKNYK